MNEGRSAAGLALAFTLVGLAAVAAGFGAGWHLRGAEPPSSSAPAPLNALADGVTHEEFQSVRGEILAELERLGRMRSEGVSPLAAPNADAMIEIANRIDELEKRVALLGPSTHSSPGGPAWNATRGQGSGSIDAIRERECAWLKSGEYASQADTIVREHQLWTIEDVIQAYGPPAQVLYYNDARTLVYGRFQIEGTDEPCVILFRFRDGFVWEVDLDCNSRWH